MIYHPEEHKIAKIVKFFAFWCSLFAMAWIFIAIFNADLKVPQKEITLELDVTNKVNICLPEDEDLFEEESFFNF